jgi:NAD(P)-dependent dehydrogenase (short-subunit alcohol dehydrogenase family)
VSRVVVITGAARGLGLEVARQLAERGDAVVVTARDLEAAHDAAERLGGLAAAAQLDVTDETSVAELGEHLAMTRTHVDVLVNNAAVLYDTFETAVDADLELVREAFETNVLGAWRVTQALLPLLRGSAHPRVVNVSSESGSLESMGGGTPAYGISKAALNALTRKLADELRDEEILVNAVCPGWTATDMGGSGGRPVADGAMSIIWGADIPDGGPTGGFFRDGERLDW